MSLRLFCLLIIHFQYSCMCTFVSSDPSSLHEPWLEVDVVRQPPSSLNADLSHRVSVMSRGRIHRQSHWLLTSECLYRSSRGFCFIFKWEEFKSLLMFFVFANVTRENWQSLKIDGWKHLWDVIKSNHLVSAKLNLCSFQHRVKGEVCFFAL